MPRRAALIVAFCLLALVPRWAQALAGFGVEGGLFTPTRGATKQLNSEWQLGLRLLLPPFTPIGTLNIGGLNLDVGLDLGIHAAGNLTSSNLSSQMFNLTAVYRYSFPLGQRLAAYLGLGGQMTAAWGKLTEDYAKGSLWGHLEGEMSAAAGLDYVLAAGVLLDVRASYGLFGFTAWDVSAGLLLAG